MIKIVFYQAVSKYSLGQLFRISSMVSGYEGDE